MSYIAYKFTNEIKNWTAQTGIKPKNSLKIEVMRQNMHPGLTHDLHTKIHKK